MERKKCFFFFFLLPQAQRDYFGAHTYERVDQPGAFHTEWIAAAAAAKNKRKL